MAPLTLPDWFKRAGEDLCTGGTGRLRSQGFLEKTLDNIASFLKGIFENEEYASKNGFLQGLDPRARIAGALLLITASAVTAHAAVLIASLFILGLFMYLSGVGFRALAKRVLPSFVFTSIIVLPVVLSVVTPGRDIFGLSFFGVSVTEEGAGTAVFLLVRVTTMVSFAALLLLTTKQSEFFRGLRGLPIPSFFVTALFMTFRYLFILLKTAEDLALARKSRTIRGTDLGQSQDWFSSRIGFMLKKSMNIAEEVNIAMASRGFTGKVRTFSDGRMGGREYLWLGVTSFVLFLSFGF